MLFSYTLVRHSKAMVKFKKKKAVFNMFLSVPKTFFRAETTHPRYIPLHSPRRHGLYLYTPVSHIARRRRVCVQHT